MTAATNTSQQTMVEKSDVLPIQQ